MAKNGKTSLPGQGRSIDQRNNNTFVTRREMLNSAGKWMARDKPIPKVFGSSKAGNEQ